MPYFISDRYRFQLVHIDQTPVIFAYAKDRLDPILTVKKSVQQIERFAQIPTVLISEKMNARQRNQLIDNGIPFIVPGRQIYLPFLGIALSEKYSDRISAPETLSPSAQLVALYYIHTKKKLLYMSETVHALGLKAMTVSRAFAQLEATEIFTTRKDGVQKILEADSVGKELFERISGQLTSPVKKNLYLKRTQLPSTVLRAGLLALSDRTMLNSPIVPCYAVREIPAEASDWDEDPTDDETQAQLEIWHYDPSILREGSSVGTLPLILSLREESDERIQEAVEEALMNYWEVYDRSRF